MIYTVRVNKKLKNTQVYAVTKRLGAQKVGLMTRIFIRLFSVFIPKEESGARSDSSAGRMG